MRLALVLLPEYSPDLPYLAQGYLAAELRRAGHDVTVFDFNVETYAALSNEANQLWSEDAAALWIDARSFAENVWPRIAEISQSQLARLVNGDFGLVGFSVFNSNCRATVWMARQLRARRPEVKIAIGGPGATLRSMRAEHVRGLFDVLVRGEGEVTLLELVDRAGNGSRFDKVPGTVGGDLRPPMDIAKLPMPDWGDLTELPYRTPWQPIEFSRGCPYRCSFCTDRTIWPGFRVRTPKSVVNEMEYRRDKWGTRRFLAVDALLNADVKWLDELANLIRGRRLEVEWGGNLRVNPKMTRAHFGRLREAGLVHAVLGVESGSKHVLDLMNKGIDPTTSVRNVSDCSRVGIVTIINILVGYHGETELDFAATCRLVERVWRDIDHINLSRFCPGEGFDESIAPAIPVALRNRRVAILEPAVVELKASMAHRHNIEKQLHPSVGRTRARSMALSFARRSRPEFRDVCQSYPAGEDALVV